VSFYSERILPHLIHWAMSQETFSEYRQRLVPAAGGRVLEIGAGSGLNLPFYSAKAENVVALDPSPQLLAWARSGTTRHPRVLRIEGTAEAIPLEDHCVDTVLTTWTLCSIRDVIGALNEVRRVLKPSGKLLFVEHGRAPDAAVHRWQGRLTPVWKRVAGGCHLNRPVDRLIEDAGFSDRDIDNRLHAGPSGDDLHV